MKKWGNKQLEPALPDASLGSFNETRYSRPLAEELDIGKIRSGP